MATIKISSKVEAQVWEELGVLAKESHQNVFQAKASEYEHVSSFQPSPLEMFCTIFEYFYFVTEA